MTTAVAVSLLLLFSGSDGGAEKVFDADQALLGIAADRSDQQVSLRIVLGDVDGNGIVDANFVGGGAVGYDGSVFKLRSR